ncbi:reverse transcriptase domain-containing protein [Tanacetum coccineum]
MEELCRPTLNGRGGPIAPIAIQATNFGLKNDMIQQVQNSCPFRGPGDDANNHLDKFLHVTLSMKVNGVSDDALRLCLFPYSLQHRAAEWFDRLPRNSITTFDQMANMFLGKYFPPSMVTKLRNDITNFHQEPDESLFEAWERYKISIDRWPNHNMLPMTQIDTFYNGLPLRHRDTINAAVGGTFTKRRPEECYDLIENMTAHHNDWDTSAQRSESSNSITSSNPEISALELKMAEINKNLMKMLQINQQVNSVTPSCETCGGSHSYINCPATVSQTQNVYAAGAYNQGGNTYQPQGNRNLLSYRLDNYLGPPGFNANQNQNRNNQNQNQNRNQGNNQGQNQFFQEANHVQNPTPAYQAPTPAYHAPPYQAPVHQTPIPQPQVVTNAEFSSYMKANDAILKNMQTNMTTLTNSTNDLKNMLGQFMKMNTTSTSGSGTLPSNTITNPREDLKVVERETEVTKDTVPPTNNRSTEDVQPPVVQVETHVPISEPVVAPVSAPKPNPKPSIPYPSRLNNQKLREKANNQMEKFYQIFQDLHFDISFADALILMPKFASTLKSLISNKEKLFELARTPLNEHCLAVLLKKLPKKFGDPGKFLISCDFPEMDECLALADLGASINLMSLSVWKELSLPELTPTCMTLELADRSISRPIGVAEDVSVKVGKFQFLTDFVVVDFDADPRVPLILGRSFLNTGRALIDVYEGELSLLVGKEAVTFNLDQTSRYSSNYDDNSINRIDIIDVACEVCSQEVLGFFVSGNPTPTLELIGDILLLEEFLNDDPSSPPLPLQELKVVKPKNEKSSIDEPPVVEYKELPPHLEYAFLEGDDKLPVIIAKDLKDEEKAALIKVLKSHKQAIAWKLSDIKGINPKFCTYKILMEDHFKPAVQHQRRVNPKIYNVIKKEVLKLLNAGLIYPISDSPWISKNGIEVDKAKVDVIAKLPHPTTVKGIRSFLGHVGFYRRFIKDFLKIAWPMTRLLEKDTPFFFSKECIESFQTLKKKLTEEPILIAPDWDLPFELMCDASDYAIGVVLRKQKEKHFRPIHYASKTMTEAQAHYTTAEKEMLAVVYAFEKFRSYLVLSKSIVHTDHSALKYLFRHRFHGAVPVFTEEQVYTRGGRLLVKMGRSESTPHQRRPSCLQIPKSLFARFGTPRAIISDRGTHFYNDQFSKVMLKYGVTHRLATTYHPQTSGQVEVSNRGLKRILERIIGENRASSSDKLDDALWAFRTAFKTPIRCTPYKLVYGKACHLPIQLEHKAYWALKHANFDLKSAGDHRKVQLNELNKLRDQACENSLIHKEKTKKIHNSKIKNCVFNVGDRVLLFNSRLKIFSGKLKIRWTKPFTVAQVFPYGTVELSQTDRPNFKVNGHRLKHYFGGDIPHMVISNLQTFPKD